MQLASAITHCFHRYVTYEVQPPRAPCISQAPQWRDALFSLHTIRITVAAAPEAQAERAWDYHGPQRRTRQRLHRRAPRSAFSGVLRAQALHMLRPRFSIGVQHQVHDSLHCHVPAEVVVTHSKQGSKAIRCPQSKPVSNVWLAV